ncbi:MAG: VTT domain-containing protein [Thermodesulfobacteriota bacterium]
MIKTKASIQSINWAIVFTVVLVIMSLVVPLYFQDEFFRFGKYFLSKYGQTRLDLTLFLITFVSSTPLAVPVWSYAVFGAAMGFDPVRLIIVVSLGAACGSSVTYFIGRYFGSTNFVRKRFPNLERHPWTSGKSVFIVSLLLFFGTASPLPIDVVYVACGLKKFYFYLFWPIAFCGRIVKYTYLIHGYMYLQNMEELNTVLFNSLN